MAGRNEKDGRQKAEGRRRKAAFAIFHLPFAIFHFPFVICLVSSGRQSVTIDDNSMTNDK